MKGLDSFKPLKEAFRMLTDLPETEWKWFLPFLEIRELRKNQHWIKAGDSGNTIGFIVSGLMRVYYQTSSGDEFTRNFRAENQFVAAYAAALSGGDAEVFVQALEPTAIITFPYDKFHTGFSRHPSWAEIGRKMTEFQYLARATREYELLCFSADERYRSFLRRFNSIRNRLNQTHIASYLGITPVSLSRLKVQLRSSKKN